MQARCSTPWAFVRQSGLVECSRFYACRRQRAAASPLGRADAGWLRTLRQLCVISVDTRDLVMENMMSMIKLPTRTFVLVLPFLWVVMTLGVSHSRAQETFPGDSAPVTQRLFLPVILRESSLTGPEPTPTPEPIPERAWSVYGLRAEIQASSLPALSASGATWLRPSQSVQWSKVEPVEGQRNWQALEALDAELILAAQKGFWTILTIESTPAWAGLAPGDGVLCGPISPNKLSAFSDFMRDLVARYSQPAYQVHYWILWDEIDTPWAQATGDSPGCWGDPSASGYGGRSYADMLAVAAPAVKAVDPGATIILGGLKLDCKDCPSAHFLEGVLLNDGGRFFDAVGFYAIEELSVFDFPWGSTFQSSSPGWQTDWLHGGPVLRAKADFIRGVLEQHQAGEKRLIGLGSHLRCDTCQAGDPDYLEARSNYLAEVYASSAEMEAVVWDDFADLTGPDFTPQFPQDGLYYAYQFSRLEGPGSAETYLGRIQPGDVAGFSDIRGYKYRRPGAEIWILWLVSTETASREVQFSQTPVIAYNVFGDPINILPEVAIGVSPVTVVFPK